MRTKLLLILVLCLFASSAATAEGFYAGLGFGVVKIKDEDSSIPPPLDDKYSDTVFGWQLFGGYDLNDRVGFELAYIQTDTAEDEVFGDPGNGIPGVPVETELSAYTASVLGYLPPWNDARLYGRLGYYSGEQEATVMGVTVDDDSDGFIAGLGVRFGDATNDTSFRGEFVWYDTDFDQVWSINMTVQYLFGN